MLSTIADEFAKRPVPDGLWEITEPLSPTSPKRAQGGGKARADDRATFDAIVFVLTTRLRLEAPAAEGKPCRWPWAPA